jgi:hypothetical protein
MAHGAVTTTHPAKVAAAGASPSGRLGTILHVQWALAIACSYLVLFGRESGDPDALGPLVVVGFLATNLIVGRLPVALVERTLFGVALAAVDSALIVASLYVAGQLSVELVLLCLGILILAIAGLRIGPIALATLALTAVYLTIVWFTGDATLWRSSVLLRVPLLFTAAIVYAWLVELGSRGAAARVVQIAGDPTSTLLDQMTVQGEAIERCEAALRAGAMDAAVSALRDVAAGNEAMRTGVAALTRGR